MHAYEAVHVVDPVRSHAPTPSIFSKVPEDRCYHLKEHVCGDVLGGEVAGETHDLLIELNDGVT